MPRSGELAPADAARGRRCPNRRGGFFILADTRTIASSGRVRVATIEGTLRLRSVSRRVLVPYSEIAGVRPYEDALAAAGIDPAACPVSHAISLSDFDGLLLTGLVDIDPALYQETRRRETEVPDDGRDSMELSLLREALERDLPILAICRGLQLLNVYHGGSLIQHLNFSARHQRIDGDRSLPAHAVIIQPGTLLSSIAGTGIWQVNSRHHQAANTIGKACAYRRGMPRMAR